jgi:phage tail-like protein
MANGEQKIEPIKYWKMQADKIAELGMFYECSLPSMTLTATEFKVWDDQSKPMPLPVGVQASFGEVTLKRVVDTKRELWNWTSTIAQKGATPDTVKEVTLIACSATGDPVETWTLMNCYPTGYQSAGMAAGGTAELTESINLKFTDAKLDGKGGLTGPLD